LVAGRDAIHQGSATLGYNDVRHTCVGIEQFLSELVLGTWLGSVDDDTVRLASGENTTIFPRYIFEITVEAAEREH
jgi:hypothetical protein